MLLLAVSFHFIYHIQFSYIPSDISWHPKFHTLYNINKYSFSYIIILSSYAFANTPMYTHDLYEKPHYIEHYLSKINMYVSTTYNGKFIVLGRI